MPPIQSRDSVYSGRQMNRFQFHLSVSPEAYLDYYRGLIRTVLRRTLQFSGLILTDDLEMGALRTFGSIGEAAVRATEAGHDLLLICSDLDAAEDAASSLRRAYQGGRLPLEELAESASKLARLRRKFSL